MEVRLQLETGGRGSFVIQPGSEPIAEMLFAIRGGMMIVYHTEVVPESEGKGLAKELLDALVVYARKNKLEIVARCPYVRSVFQRHPEEYKDVWNPSTE